MTKPLDAWAVVDENGEILDFTVAEDKDYSEHAAAEHFSTNWDSLKESGEYNCIRVTIKPKEPDEFGPVDLTNVEPDILTKKMRSIW